LEVQPNYVKDLTVSTVCCQTTLEDILLYVLEFIGIDASSMVPHGIVFGVDFQQLRRLL
jgi:hypothetical protein